VLGDELDDEQSGERVACGRLVIVGTTGEELTAGVLFDG
jgi:hypothetical protein